MVGKDKFYTSKTWRNVRKVIIAESGGICNRCHRAFPSKDLIVHHIKHLQPGDYNNPDKAYNKDNLEVVCVQCHNKEHDRFATSKSVVIVYGAPLSGKHTFVKDNMSYGDIIIDIDSVYSAISGREMFDKPNALRFNAFRVQDTLIDMVRTRYGYWHTAWIIGGYPSSLDRDRLAKKLNATLVHIEATEEECLSRLETVNDYRREDKKNWSKYIRDWFSKYTPPTNTK